MSISLTTPLALLGLLALPVIAALHMLRSRRQVYPVSSLSLWNFLNPQLTGSAARRLPLTWLLFIDLLIAALLSLALAGPNLDLTRTIREGRHIVLVLDMSTSMAADDARPSRFAAARAELMSLAAESYAQDAVTVIGFAQAAFTLADSRSTDFPAQLDAVNRRLPAGEGANLTAALALAKSSVDPQLPAEVHVFTDAAFSAPDLADFDIPVEWHIFGRSRNNQAVLSLQALALSDLKLQVFARAANFSLEPVTRSLVLRADGADLDFVEITIEPESSVTHTWEIVGRGERISVRLDGRDDLSLDDVAFTTVERVNAAKSVRIALVTDNAGPVLKALQAVPGTDIQLLSPDDYLPGSPYDMVVFSQFLPERWPAGIVLVVDPPAESRLLGQVRARPVTELPFPQPDDLLADVDFTGVRWDSAWQPENIPVGLEPVLSAGTSPILLHGRAGLSDIVLLLAQVSDANGTPTAFARHPAFPVLVANIVRDAAGIQLPNQLATGTALTLPGPDRQPGLRIDGPEPTGSFSGSERPLSWPGAALPGFYEFIFTDLDGRETSYVVGVNAASLAESQIAPAAWPGRLESPPMPAASTEQPISLVPWLLAAVAVLMLLEAWLSWR